MFRQKLGYHKSWTEEENLQKNNRLAYHELMRPLGDEEIKRSETSALMASLERLITKQMHNSKTTKIVPFTDEELDWLLSSTT